MKSTLSWERMSCTVDDAGVIQGRGGLGLLHETLLSIGIGDLVGRQDLEGHDAAQMRVASPVDDTHPALAQLRFDLVAIQALTDHRERIALGLS